MTYQDFIQDILDSRGRHGCGDEYKETHHIRPRCMGGDDSEDNLIDLFGREHVIAHKLLAQENPSNRALTHAYWMMVHCGVDHHECIPEEYEEARIAFSESMKGAGNPMYGLPKEQNPNYGRKCSQETKDKLRKANIGRKHTEEAKQKMGRSHMGKYCGTNSPNYGLKRTDEEKEKNRLAHLGKNMGKDHPNAKAIYCIELDKKFDCAMDASRELGISPSALCLCLKGHTKTSGKYHWIYYDDYIKKKKRE